MASTVLFSLRSCCFSLRCQTSLRKLSAFGPSQGSDKSLPWQQRIPIQSDERGDEAGLDFIEAKGAVILFKCKRGSFCPAFYILSTHSGHYSNSSGTQDQC